MRIDLLAAVTGQLNPNVRSLTPAHNVVRGTKAFCPAAFGIPWCISETQQKTVRSGKTLEILVLSHFPRMIEQEVKRKVHFAADVSSHEWLAPFMEPIIVQLSVTLHENMMTTALTQFLHFRTDCHGLPRDIAAWVSVPRRQRICNMCQHRIIGMRSTSSSSALHCRDCLTSALI